MDYIKVDDCKDGYLYKIYSRNLTYGIYSKQSGGFLGIRYKWNEYLDVEYHMDTGGTVTPHEEIKECPMKDLKERYLIKMGMYPNYYIEPWRYSWEDNDLIFDWIKENT